VLTDLPEEFGAKREQRPELIRGLEQIRSVKKLRRTEAGMLRGFGLGPSPQKLDYGHRCPGSIIADTSASLPELVKYIAAYYIANDVPPEEQLDVLFAVQGGLILASKAPDHSFSNVNSSAWRPHFAGFGPSPATTSLFFLRLVSDIGPELPIGEPVLQRYLKLLPRPAPACGAPMVRLTGA
jgi:hypothetical protein